MGLVVGFDDFCPLPQVEILFLIFFEFFEFLERDLVDLENFWSDSPRPRMVSYVTHVQESDHGLGIKNRPFIGKI